MALAVFTIFVAINLSSVVGLPLAVMSIIYLLFTMQNKILPFVTKSIIDFKYIIFGGLSVFLWASISTGLFSVNAFSALASVGKFGIDNPLMLLLIWGIVIPLVENGFFFGVLFKFISEKARSSNRLQDIGTIVTICVVAASATLFHVSVRGLSDAALMIDLLFFGISGVLVVVSRNIQASGYAHILVNSIVVATSIGWIRI